LSAGVEAVPSTTGHHNIPKDNIFTKCSQLFLLQYKLRQLVGDKKKNDKRQERKEKSLRL
jgi:hypothetical protein